MIHNVANCSRCGGTHMNLTFKAMQRQTANNGWSHFSMCPTTGEPVMLKVGGGDHTPPRKEIKADQVDPLQLIEQVLADASLTADELRPRVAAIINAHRR